MAAAFSKKLGLKTRKALRKGLVLNKDGMRLATLSKIHQQKIQQFRNNGPQQTPYSAYELLSTFLPGSFYFFLLQMYFYLSHYFINTS